MPPNYYIRKLKLPWVVPLDILKDKDSDVRLYAPEALMEITGKYFGEDQAQWQKWWEENKEDFLKGE